MDINGSAESRGVYAYPVPRSGRIAPEGNIEAASVQLFVGQIPKTMNENELRDLFETTCTVLSVTIIRDRETHLPKCCAFVRVRQADADRVIGYFHNRVTFDGVKNPIQVRPATPRAPSNRNSSNSSTRINGKTDLYSMKEQWGYAQSSPIPGSKLLATEDIPSGRIPPYRSGPPSKNSFYKGQQPKFTITTENNLSPQQIDDQSLWTSGISPQGTNNLDNHSSQFGVSPVSLQNSTVPFPPPPMVFNYPMGIPSMPQQSPMSPFMFPYQMYAMYPGMPDYRYYVPNPMIPIQYVPQNEPAANMPNGYSSSPDFNVETEYDESQSVESDPSQPSL